MKDVSETLKQVETLADKSGKREHPGFKLGLSFTGSECSVSLQEVRYQKVKSKAMANIFRKATEKCKECEGKGCEACEGRGWVISKYLVQGKYMDKRTFLVEENPAYPGDSERGKMLDTEVDEQNIVYVQRLEDGREIPVEGFDRIDAITVTEEDLIDMVKAESDYIFESYYEVWSNNSVFSLWRLAKHLLDNDKAILYADPQKPFSFGGKKCYTAVIWPVVSDGKFVFVMGLTNVKKEWSHLMSCNQEDVQVKPAVKKNGVKKAAVVLVK
jgi:hypothetical protein